jgi:hypothetical protein
MIVSTRVWTPLEEFELEFDEVFPASAALAATAENMIATATAFMNGLLRLG